MSERLHYGLEYQLDFETAFLEVIGDICLNLHGFTQLFPPTMLSHSRLWTQGRELTYLSFSIYNTTGPESITSEHFAFPQHKHRGRVYVHNYLPDEQMKFSPGDPQMILTYDQFTQFLRKDLANVGARNIQEINAMNRPFSPTNVIPFDPKRKKTLKS